MKQAIDFLIVEDELLIAENISAMLAGVGYTQVRIVTSVEEALKEIRVQRPGMVLTDIDLGEGRSGIDLGRMLQEQYGIPFIYVTSHAGTQVIGKAKHTRPNAYIVKPFKKEDLLVAIELALFNTSINAAPVHEQIELKEGRAIVHLDVDKIQWLENEGNYTTINLSDKTRRVVRMSLLELLRQLPSARFIRIHKSYVVNRTHVSEVRPNSVIIQSHEFPVGRTYQKVVKAIL